MRVTNSLVTHDIMSRLQTGQRRVAEAQERVTTGLRIRKMSDDPSDASALLQTSAALRSLAQYKRNVQGVGSRLSAEESSLDSLTAIMTRAKELATQGASDNTGRDGRIAAAAEVQQLLEQAIAVGNQTYDEEYLFGGANSAAQAPFDKTQTAAPNRYVSQRGTPAAAVVPQGSRAVEIAAGQTMPSVHDGKTVFLDTGVFDALHDLQAALASDDTAAVDAATTKLDGAFGGVQALIGDVGARQNRVDTLTSGFDALELNLTERKSDLREVDMEQAITEMLNRQTAYQAAMLAASKVMGMSLTDYLR